MTDVGMWQPHGPAIDGQTLVRLANAADHLDHATLGLSADDVRELAGLMKHPRDQWPPLLATEGDARLVQLVKFFTVAEMRLPGWEAGAHSPVIALVAELRRRNAYPKELTAWIKAHTTNRFLPHGSLLDRL